MTKRWIALNFLSKFPSKIALDGESTVRHANANAIIGPRERKMIHISHFDVIIIPIIITYLQIHKGSCCHSHVPFKRRLDIPWTKWRKGYSWSASAPLCFAWNSLYYVIILKGQLKIIFFSLDHQNIYTKKSIRSYILFGQLKWLIKKEKIEMNREKNIFQSRGYISNVCVCVCMRACACVCLRACVCGCVGVCVRSRVRNWECAFTC